jgi:hypothetical protein
MILAGFASQSHIVASGGGGSVETRIVTTDNTNPISQVPNPNNQSGMRLSNPKPRGKEEVFDPNAFGQLPPADPDDLEEQIEILLEQGKKKEAQKLIDQYNDQLNEAVGVDGVNPDIKIDKPEEPMGPLNWDFNAEPLTCDELKEFQESFNKFRLSQQQIKKIEAGLKDYKAAKEYVKASKIKDRKPGERYFGMDGVEVSFVTDEEPPF